MSLGSYKNTDIYKNTYDSAYNSIDKASGTFDLNYTQILGNAGWDAKSKGGLAALGIVMDIFTLGNSSKRARERARDAIHEGMDNAKESYKGFSKDIANYRTQAMHLVNTTKANFDSTFGADSYDMFDSLFNSAISTGSIDSLVQSLQTDDNIENAGSINTLLEYMSEEQREKLLTSNMSINDINDSYYNFLSEYFGKQNTQYGYQMRQMSQKEEYLNEQNNIAMENIQQQYSKQISDMVNEQRQKNRSMAESMGSTSAEAGASGIRRNKATNAEIIQKYEVMLDAVAYSSALNFVLKQYENNLKNTQSGYLYQAYELRNSMSQSTQSMIASYVAQGNQKQNAQIDMIYKIEAAEQDAMNAIAEYNALKDAEAQYDADAAARAEEARKRMEQRLNNRSTDEDSDENFGDNGITGGDVHHSVQKEFELDTDEKGHTNLSKNKETDLGGTLAILGYADTNSYKYQPEYVPSNFENQSIADRFGPPKSEVQQKEENENPNVGQNLTIKQVTA